MVQTPSGAAKNPWIQQIKKCASKYHEERKAPPEPPRRRLQAKSPEAALHAAPAPKAAPVASPQPVAVAAPAKAAAPVAAAAGPQVVSTLSLEARKPLLPFVNRAREYLGALEGRKTTAARLFMELASVGDLKEALRAAGLPTKAPIAAFVKAFPALALETGARGGTTTVALR